MQTIKFYTNKNKYAGWKKFKSFCDNWLECKNWINSGNSIVFDNIRVEAYNTGHLRVVLGERN